MELPFPGHRTWLCRDLHGWSWASPGVQVSILEKQPESDSGHPRFLETLKSDLVHGRRLFWKGGTIHSGSPSPLYFWDCPSNYRWVLVQLRWDLATYIRETPIEEVWNKREVSSFLALSSGGGSPARVGGSMRSGETWIPSEALLCHQRM